MSGQLPEADRLIVEAATGRRQLSRDELRRVLAHVAQAGFQSEPNARVGGRAAGLVWKGRVLQGRDRLTSAEAHYLRHVLAQREWPDGTTLEAYLQSLHDVVLDPTSGLLVSRFPGTGWHLAVVRRSGELRGPNGNDWLLVEYRIETGHWMTGFEPRNGLRHLTGDPQREAKRWLRRPR